MKVKKLLVIGSWFIALTLVLLLVKTAGAQEDPNQVAKKHGVTFPITELGGCKDFNECRTYCSDPANKDACIAFAKSKGFYKEDTKSSNTTLQKAKEVLGCDSITSCKSFCDNPQNYDKCQSFAQSTGVSGGYKEDPRKADVLGKAEKAFGCNSYDTCKSFCDSPANRDRCAAFASGIGLNGGYEYRGPGGCTSEDSCRTFCSNPLNTEICRNYSQSQGGIRTNFDPQTECRKYSGCTWRGNYCQCNPNDPGNLERQRSQCLTYPGCSWTGNTCQCSGYGAGRESQEAACKAGGGTCLWNNDICNCQGYHSGGGGYSPYPNATHYPSSYTPYPTSGNTMTKDQQEAYCKAGGGTCLWNNDICNCQGYQSSGSTTTTTQSPQPTTTTSSQNNQPVDPSTACNQTPGCSWNGSTCSCSSVQGAATVYVKSFFDYLLDLLRP